MNPSFKHQTLVQNPRFRNCFLCDVRFQSTQIRNVDHIFYVTPPQKTNQEPNKSLASILTEVLEHELTESGVHSRFLCKKCQQNCLEYDRIAKRLETLRQIMKNNYNETVQKYNMKSVAMELENNFAEHSNLSNMYAIESVGQTMGEVFNNENITNIGTSTTATATNPIQNANKVIQVKKVMLIKSENDTNPFFTISGIDEESIDDNQTIHKVLLEEINDGTEFTDSAANTNDGMSADEHESGEQYVVTEPLDDDGKEYFEATDDQMIEITTNGDISNSNQYQYVFQDDDSDPLHENIAIEEEDDEQDAEEEDDDDDDDDGQLQDEYLKDDLATAMTFTVKTMNRATSKKSNPTHEQKQLFIRNGKEFQCLLCQPTTNVIYDTKTISIHLKTDHNERIYVCSICGLDFRKRNPYNEHMDDHVAATANGAYECDICKATFSDARQFRLHKKTHNSSIKIWSCKACEKKYSSKNLLDEHMNMHTGERPYKCPHCVKDFASKYTLTAHMKIHYDRKRPYECKECGKSFFSNQNLTQHVRTHTGVKEYECDVCGKKFGSPHNLEVHKIVHTGHKPFLCRTCGKAFARRAEIKDHERTHTGERPYKCDLCTSSFAQRSNLMSHKRATHFNDKRYKCETCNRSFKRRRLLEYHIKATHTGERPYKCSECNSTFVYPEHYKKHIRIHTGVKPFACEVCGKSFNSRDNRNAHRYVHSDKKPYECLVCHQGFMRKPLLYAHMEAQNHLNDKIIVNQPRIAIKKENNNLDPNQSTSENEDIVYLNLNEEDLLDDDEYATIEEEHIEDDGEITNEDDFIIDNQFTNDADPNQSESQIEDRVFNKQFLIRPKITNREHVVEMDELTSSIVKDNDTVTFIETSGTEDILTHIDGDNSNWMSLSS